MDTNDTTEKTAPSAAPAKPAPKPRPGEPEPEEPVPSVLLSGWDEYLFEGLGVAISGLSVGAAKGKDKRKGAVDMGAEEEDRGDAHDPCYGIPFDDKPPESAPSASDHPAAPRPATTALAAAHSATSSLTTTPPMAQGLDFTAMPHPTLWCEPSLDCATYGNCSRRTSGIQLHQHRYP